MKITPKNFKPRKFQMGGQMGSDQYEEEPTQEQEVPTYEETPEEDMEQGEQQDPLVMLAQMSAQALQSQDCQMAMQVCQAFLEIINQMQGGAPQEQPSEPVFRKGGILVRRIIK